MILQKHGCREVLPTEVKGEKPLRGLGQSPIESCLLFDNQNKSFYVVRHHPPYKTS